MHKKLFLVGAASHLGSQIEGCSYGAKQLCLKEDLSAWIEKSGHTIADFEIIFPDEHKKKDLLVEISLFNQKLAHIVFSALEKKEVPIVLGGDHSISVGTWSGVLQFLKKKQLGKLGLVWFDAHLNAQISKNTSTDLLCKKSVSSLLGIGEKSLKEVYPDQSFLEPQNLCIIGARSYEKEEKDLLDQLGVQVYSYEEIFRRGIDKIIDEALEYILQNSSHLGLSINLDFFDPQEAPGVAFPEKDGFFKKDIFPALKKITKDPFFMALEIVEFNPYFDQKNMTKNLIIEMLGAIFGENNNVH